MLVQHPPEYNTRQRYIWMPTFCAALPRGAQSLGKTLMKSTASPPQPRQGRGFEGFLGPLAHSVRSRMLCLPPPVRNAKWFDWGNPTDALP